MIGAEQQHASAHHGAALSLSLPAMIGAEEPVRQLDEHSTRRACYGAAPPLTTYV